MKKIDLLSIMTLGISIASIIMTDNDISISENRTLAKVPQLASITELASSEYFTKWDTYLSDQIVFRDTFVNLYINAQPLLFRQYINDVYFGNGDFLFSLGGYTSKSDADLQLRATYLNEIQAEFGATPLYFVNLPSKEMVYESLVGMSSYVAPKTADFNALKSYLSDEIKVIDMLEILKSDEKNYYKTDHHWTMAGTYLGYQEIIETLVLDFPTLSKPLNETDFEIQAYEHYFLGSEGRRVNPLVDNLETIEIWRSPYDSHIEVIIDGEVASLFDVQKLSEDRLNNDYTVYLGGDHAKEVITNKAIDNEITIALVGDSMSNALVGLLANNVQTIYSYDLRHYEGDVISEINALDVDLIIFSGLTANFTNSHLKVFNLKE